MWRRRWWRARPPSCWRACGCSTSTPEPRSARTASRWPTPCVSAPRTARSRRRRPPTPATRPWPRRSAGSARSCAAGDAPAAGVMTEPPRRPAGQWTPAELGVHHVTGDGLMPAYVRRPHDEQLQAVLDPETEYSRLVVIRGDALSGKSRAAYEAVTGVLTDWTLEHPPTVAALAARLEA